MIKFHISSSVPQSNTASFCFFDLVNKRSQNTWAAINSAYKQVNQHFFVLGLLEWLFSHYEVNDSLFLFSWLIWVFDLYTLVWLVHFQKWKQYVLGILYFLKSLERMSSKISSMYPWFYWLLSKKKTHSKVKVKTPRKSNYFFGFKWLKYRLNVSILHGCVIWLKI